MTGLARALVLLAVSSPALAQPWSGIVDPARAINWSPVGVGVIPARATACSTLSPNGANDMTAAINAALSSCTAGQAVVLAAGTFRVNGSIAVPANVTLRGAGANLTILDAYGSGNGAINLGSGVPAYPGVSVTSGATAGSTSLVVSSASGISVGSYLLITELDDPAYVTIQGGEGPCHWCSSTATYTDTRTRGQLVEVATVSGTTIGFTPPLYSAYARTPLVAVMTATKNAGVESLQVRSNNTGYTASFQLNACAHCWVKGVEANYTDGDFIQVHYGFRDEIRDSYFSNAFNHAPGVTDSDIFIVDKTTATLVENNIIERGHASVLLNWGAAGNVIAYNYTHGELDTVSTNFVIGGIGMHGAHPQFNLVEGNVMDELYPDQVWGSSSHNTVFRNWTTGTTRVCSPTSGGRTAVTCSGTAGWYPFQASRAMQIGRLATSFNFVGNITGSDEQNALKSYGNATSHVAVLQYPANRSYDSVNYNWTFGYGESSDSGSGTGCSGGTAPCHSTNAFATAFMHGNYTHADGAINWASGVTHVLPSSFYLSGRPAWWKAALAFPAIGPDVTGQAGAGGHAGLTPAQDCYLNAMGGTEGGAGSPLTFNADTCYHGVSAPLPAAPTGLAAVAH